MWRSWNLCMFLVRMQISLVFNCLSSFQVSMKHIMLYLVVKSPRLPLVGTSPQTLFCDIGSFEYRSGVLQNVSKLGFPSWFFLRLHWSYEFGRKITVSKSIFINYIEQYGSILQFHPIVGSPMPNTTKEFFDTSCVSYNSTVTPST